MIEVGRGIDPVHMRKAPPDVGRWSLPVAGYEQEKERGRLLSFHPTQGCLAAGFHKGGGSLLLGNIDFHYSNVLIPSEHRFRTISPFPRHLLKIDLDIARIYHGLSLQKYSVKELHSSIVAHQ